MSERRNWIGALAIAAAASSMGCARAATVETAASRIHVGSQVKGDIEAWLGEPHGVLDLEQASAHRCTERWAYTQGARRAERVLFVDFDSYGHVCDYALGRAR